MRHHPLNPMTDSSLVRVLARQTRHKVGLVPLRQVQSGSATLRTALDKLALDSVRHVVVDAVADTDLGIIGEAVGDDVLVTGGSGVALGLPAAYRRRGLITHRSGADTLPKIDGPSAVLSGSCSAATLGQIAAFKGAHLVLDTDAICRGEDIAGKAMAWVKDNLGNGPILLSASDKPDAVKALQTKYGVEKSSHAIEKTMAALARGLVGAGVNRLVVAGGETSGAVVGALSTGTFLAGALCAFWGILEILLWIAFFVAAGVMGWFEWGPKGAVPAKLTRTEFFIWSAVLLGAWVAMRPVFESWGAASTWSDTFMLVGSIVAQILMVLEKYECWPLWFVVDLVGTIEYAFMDLWFTSLLYAVFVAIAIAGWKAWLDRANAKAATR